jgi:hypothetical protein
MAYKQIGRLIVEQDDSGWIDIVKNCHITNDSYSVSVRRTDYEAWKGGKLAQLAFPYLAPEDREFIISGTSPKGWEIIFGGDNE